MKILILLVTLLLGTIHTNGSKYGQTCTNDTSPCQSPDILDPLFCPAEGKCRCPDKMFRHQTLDRCVSPQGAACTIRTGNGDSITTCTENAVCWPSGKGAFEDTNEGVCYCVAGSKYNEESGLCRLSYGSKNKDCQFECDFLDFLTCREDKCVCQEENMIFNGTICTSTVGGRCDSLADKLPKVSCSESDKMDCINGLCKCKDHFKVENGSCRKEHSDACAVDGDCLSKFVCAGGKCECPTGEEYDEVKMACRILVSQPCNPMGDLECIHNAECLRNICTCKEGFGNDAMNAGKCVALFGTSCNNNDTKCNDEDYLVCGSQNVCVCQDDYATDETNKVCKGKIGAGCKNDTNCEQGTICSKDSLTCRCPVGQESVDGSKCFALYDQACNSTLACSPKSFLQCNTTSGRCGCKNATTNGHVYDNREGIKTCVALADKVCGAQAENITCVVHAECDDEKVPNMCRCKLPEYHPVQGFCEFGEKSGGVKAEVCRLVNSLCIVLLMMVRRKSSF